MSTRPEALNVLFATTIAYAALVEMLEARGLIDKKELAALLIETSKTWFEDGKQAKAASHLQMFAMLALAGTKGMDDALKTLH